MTTRRNRILSFTDDELKAARAASGTKSDWNAAAVQPLPDGSDPDDAMEPIRMDWVMTTLPERRTKAHASLRIDADVLAWFRSQGRGYQTKINAILRSYFEQHTRSR